MTTLPLWLPISWILISTAYLIMCTYSSSAEGITAADLNAFDILTDVPRRLHNENKELKAELNEEKRRNQRMSAQLEKDWPESGIIYNPPPRTKRSTSAVPRLPSSSFVCSSSSILHLLHVN